MKTNSVIIEEFVLQLIFKQLIYLYFSNFDNDVNSSAISTLLIIHIWSIDHSEVQIILLCTCIVR